MEILTEATEMHGRSIVCSVGSQFFMLAVPLYYVCTCFQLIQERRHSHQKVTIDAERTAYFHFETNVFDTSQKASLTILKDRDARSNLIAKFHCET